MVVSWTIMTSEGPQVVSGLCLDSTVVDPFMIRCAKAVVAHAWPDLACWDVDYKVFQLEDRPYDEVFIESLRLELFKDREKGLGVFRYSGAVGEEGTSAVILFLFYGVVAFGVRWSPKE